MTSKMFSETSADQVLSAIDRLPLRDQIRIFRKLERKSWAGRLDAVVMRMRKRFKDSSLSDKDLTRLCEETRQKFHNGKTKSRH